MVRVTLTALAATWAISMALLVGGSLVPMAALAYGHPLRTRRR
jgi:hypothetical protein